ncbi:MAG TPA: hypothetical protein VFX03_09100 [Thermomicrobiales bacterium]|nr:hypothetical protein [Thermomicrobiales bacterium]
MSVARLRLSPQARFDWVFGAATLFIVETGELTLEMAGPNVSALDPSADRTPAGGRKSGGRQDGMASVAGERVVVPQSGSAFAANGNLGPIRNDGLDELSLLVFAVIDNPTAAEVTAVAVVGTPQP